MSIAKLKIKSFSSVLSKYKITTVLIALSFFAPRFSYAGDSYFSMVVGQKKISENDKTVIDIQRAVTKAQSEGDARGFESVRKKELEKDGYQITKTQIIKDEDYDKIFTEVTTSEPKEQYPVKIDTRLWDATKKAFKE